MNQLPAQKVNGIIDGLAVLQALAVSPEPVSGSQLAARLKLNPVRVSRILKTFAHLGYTYRTRSRRYAVGPAMHVLAAQSMTASGLLGRAVGYLEKLADDRLVVALGVLWHDQACYLYHKRPGQEYGFSSGFQSRPLHDAGTSSVGVALLAELSDGELAALYPDGVPDPVKEAVAETRANGYALLRYCDHYSLAVAIGVPAYAALAVSNLPDRETALQYVATLQNYVRAIANETPFQ